MDIKAQMLFTVIVLIPKCWVARRHTTKKDINSNNNNNNNNNHHHHHKKFKVIINQPSI